MLDKNNITLRRRKAPMNWNKLTRFRQRVQATDCILKLPVVLILTAHVK